MPEAEVTPRLGPSGKPIRRRGRWTYVSHQWNGPVWRLDGTTLDLEHDPDCHSVCIGSDRCNGAWVLYEDGRYREPVSEHLDAAMEEVERAHGERAAAVVQLPPSPAADAVASQEERGVITVAPGAFTVSTGDRDA